MITVNEKHNTTVLAIDASNIRDGGGITHLYEMLSVAQPAQSGIDKVIVWSGKKTLEQLPKRDWLVACEQSLLNKRLLARVIWQIFYLPKLLSQNIDVFFVPGGYFIGRFNASVILHQNALPFVKKNYFQILKNLKFLKFIILRILQSYSFKKASSVIFLSNFAFKEVAKTVKLNNVKRYIISHGINQRFFYNRDVNSTINPKKCTLLYVSRFDQYKHHHELIKAIALLKSEGLSISLQLIGQTSNHRYKVMQNLIKKYQCQDDIKLIGFVPHKDIHLYYQQADAFIFPSICESFGQTLLEAMASKLPIICSYVSVMPEIVADCGIYFNPYKSTDIAHAIKIVVNNPQLRSILAERAYKRAQLFTWQHCADRTFTAISEALPIDEVR